MNASNNPLRFGATLALLSLVACTPAGRTSIPPEESHYERTLEHTLGRAVAFGRVEGALARSYEDLPKVLVAQERKQGTFSLEPTVTYRTGGPMGSDNHARYKLQIEVHEATVEMSFDLGKDEATGTWAPATEVPYIRHDFDAVVTNVSDALAL